MNLIRVIGTEDKSFTDRPTVKAIIRHDNKILLLNNGLLPGGGVDTDENSIEALRRELREELGASVRGITPIGIVIQYRDFLRKKYIIQGFTYELIDFNLQTAPQDEGEENFQLHWSSVEAAIQMTNAAIATLASKENSDDSVQGKLFNFMTTTAFLGQIK